MEFQSSKGIFLQIADNLCHQILEGLLKPGDRVPSVRDLAEEFEVNRNTVMRTYTILQESGIFDNKRGIGFFVAGNAVELVRTNEKTRFFAYELPGFIQKVKLLKLNTNDLSELITEITNNNTQSHENQ
jgi:DNA-binding transcriptional regulator YhcF (GntR family)